jgi:hypothetical protein
MAGSEKRPDAQRAPGRFVFACAAALFVSLDPAGLRAAAQAPAPAASFALDCQNFANTPMPELFKRYGQDKDKITLTVSDAVYPNASTVSTTLFPRDAARELVVAWRSGEPNRLARVSTWARDGGWKTPLGLKVGMAIADVELLNGRAFVMRGFDQTDAGLVVSWAGGKLAEIEKETDGCRAVVRLAPTVDQFTVLESRLVDAIVGTPEVSSDDRRIRPFRATIAMLGLEWAR